MASNPDRKDAHQFYVHTMDVLRRARVSYLVGGGHALAHYTGIIRDTKDFDLFLRPQDRDSALKALADAGYRIEIPWPHFLAKALCGELFVDIIYNSGNGLCPVDDEWFRHAERGQIFGAEAPVCALEEMIWPKAFVQDRDRYDGADVAHLILARGRQMDWRRLIRRFAGHEPVLLVHAVLFHYAYPSERDCVPAWVIDELLTRARGDPPARERICKGTNLAIRQYLSDIRTGGFVDARLQPRGPLTPEQIAMLPAD